MPGKVYILGGGPAGLALADALSEKGQVFTLIEKEKQLGGLAKTIQWKQYGAHDLGPHKIFTQDKALLQRVRSLLPNDAWLTQKKISKIYLNGHYLPYPPSPFSLINVFGLPAFLKILFGFGVGKFKLLTRKNAPTSFKDDICSRVGKPLYQYLFEPIAKKLWGEPSQLDVKLSQGRVQVPKLAEIIKGILKSKNNSSEFEALSFIYPRGGLQTLWEEIRTKSSSTGDFLLGNTITTIRSSGDHISEIEVVDETGESRPIQIDHEDQIFSSLPLGLLVKLLEDHLPHQVVTQTKEYIRLNDLILVFLKTNKPKVLKESWVFVPDAKISFHRLSEQSSFDPSMTPNGSILCCELMSHDHRDLASMLDDELANLVKQDLDKLGLNQFEIEDVKVTRIPNSYPVYKPGYAPALSNILQEMDKLENLKTIGRQGGFNYIGTLDAMDIGYGAAEWHEEIKTSTSNRLDIQHRWQQERTRTEHYPVLD